MSERLRALEQELVDTNREVAQLAIELEERNRQLDAFASAVGHDLKSPLLATRLAAEMARQAHMERDGSRLEQSLEQLDGRLAQMVRLVDSLLDYARTARPGQCRESVSLDPLFGNVLGTLPVPSGFTIHRDTPPGAFVTDAPMLRQVLQNLVDNALQHHDRQDGTIELTARRTKHGLRVAVQDDGPGIPDDVLPRIYEPFYSTRKNTGGTGLGLALVRSIIRSHGGDIAAHTSPLGTTFSFDWPGRWEPERTPESTPTASHDPPHTTDPAAGRKR